MVNAFNKDGKPLIRFEPDPRGNDLGGEFKDVDRHYYRDQVRNSSSELIPTIEGQAKRATELAVADAKDRARHELIKALREEEQRLRTETFTGIGNFAGQARDNIYKNRTIDGLAGKTDNDIKL